MHQQHMFKSNYQYNNKKKVLTKQTRQQKLITNVNATKTLKQLQNI